MAIPTISGNAGYCGIRGALSKDAIFEARREMDVNYFGVLRMAHAFAPALAANGGGAIVNIVSFLALATLPLMGTYCASKSAELALSRSLTQSWRRTRPQFWQACPFKSTRPWRRGRTSLKSHPETLRPRRLPHWRPKKSSLSWPAVSRCRSVLCGGSKVGGSVPRVDASGRGIARSRRRSPTDRQFTSILPRVGVVQRQEHRSGAPSCATRPSSSSPGEAS
ncbi:SDR family NAD(P)-dependent oxidoreductase [Bradyrhizobium sp. CSA207]|nr:SDR family NAD(P)-dependent oxidoreductase [Bradyrhizobium sp. CSA207]